MSGIVIKGGRNHHLDIGSQEESNEMIGGGGLPKYIGAEAKVERLEDGVRITLTDYKGNTTTADVHDGISGDYAGLINKPSIEGVTLDGDKSFEDLTLRKMTTSEIISIVNG